jgi:polysaccharide biosynthesis/export protein
MESKMREQWMPSHRIRGRVPRAASAAAALLVVMFLSPAAGAAFPQDKTARIPDYRIGPRDLLEIKVFEAPELNQTVRVAEDGSITLGLVGKVDAAGLTVQDLEKKLAAVLDQKYTKGAHVTVFVKEYQKVTVLGGVGKPGSYELVGSTSILQVISLAGGLTPQATNRSYVYRRDKDGRKTRIVVDLESLMNGNEAADIELYANDEVIIPVEQMLTIYVYGEVKTPGAIQFKESKRITLLQAIAQAGGPNDWAAKARVTIKRKDKTTGRESNIQVNMKKIERNETPDVFLEAGDIVIVP